VFFWTVFADHSRLEVATGTATNPISIAIGQEMMRKRQSEASGAAAQQQQQAMLHQQARPGGNHYSGVGNIELKTEVAPMSGAASEKKRPNLRVDIPNANHPGQGDLSPSDIKTEPQDSDAAMRPPTTPGLSCTSVLITSADSDFLQPREKEIHPKSHRASIISSISVR
jgi:hypothetical protein